MIKTSLTTAALLLAAVSCHAMTAWDSVREELYGARTLNDGADVIAIDAPYRTYDDARTDLAAKIVAPRGLTLGKVTVVLDENPMPVSAVFSFDEPQSAFYFDVTMRVNGPTPVHVIAETTDGQLWVAETFVKTSGQGACAAPPGTDPVEALASLGQMQIGIEGTVSDWGSLKPGALSMLQRRLDLDISHPSHSGMQMDQISLLFIPMRYVETVEVDLNGGGYVDLTGSISLSENPRVALSVPRETQSVDVTMTDTDGTVSHASKRLAGF